MIWTIVKREFLSNLMTFRFGVGLILCLVLVVLSAFVLTKDYAKRLESYDLAVQQHQDELRNLHVWSALQPRIDRRPGVLSIFHEGVEKRLGTTVRIYWEEVPTYATEQGKKNPYLAIFPTLDLVTIISVVLSLLAILFAYDAIVGEKEMGTLRLTLSNPVPRDTVLLGKYLAGIASLFIPLAISFLAGLIVITLSPIVSLSAGDWGNIALIFLLSLVYISAFFLLGLFLSARTKRRSTCLMLLLVVWILFVVIVPNAGPYIAKRIYTTVSTEKVETEKREIWGEMNRKIAEKGDEINVHLYDHMVWMSDVSNMRGTLVRYSSKETMDAHLRRTKFVEPLRIKYAEKVWRIEETGLNQLARQTRLAKTLSLVSPVTPFSAATGAIAGTDIQSFDRFMSEARRYRGQMIEYLKSKDAFNSYRFFSDDTEEDQEWSTAILKEWMTTGKFDREAITKKFEADMADPNKKLKLGDMPRFRFAPESAARRVQRVLLDIGILLFFNIAFFFAAFVSFLRYDVR